MKKLLSCLLLSVAAISTPIASAEAGTFYVSTNRSQVGVIDDLTGFYTQLASTPRFTDIALDPLDELWGITFRWFRCSFSFIAYVAIIQCNIIVA
ncbi:MAG: hypothetical protein F6K24_50130 [Okeania sp. SIO2D1]|nr:hypothetical protein [Okeania sp. SIO2D1]